MKTMAPAPMRGIRRCFQRRSRDWDSGALSFGEEFGGGGGGGGFDLGEGAGLGGLRLAACWSVDDRVRHLRGWTRHWIWICWVPLNPSLRGRTLEAILATGFIVKLLLLLVLDYELPSSN